MQKHLVKTLIAAAIVSASFAAHAVDFYGNVDAGYTHTNAGGVKTQGFDSGLKDPSFIGFRGAEDLGRGLKAEFVLESGFDVTSGAQDVAGTAFSRNAYLGLTGGFGAIKLGQVSSFSRNIVKQYDAFGGEAWGVAGGQFNTFGGFQSNTVAYGNSFGPVKAGVSFKAAEVVGGGLDKGAVLSLSAGYERGPMSAGIVYTEDKSSLIDTVKTTQIGGAYDLKFAKVSALYENGKNAAVGATKDGYLIGLKAPVNAATSVLATVGHKEAFGGAEHDLFAVGAQYNLSKRTSLYASFSKDDAKDAGKVEQFAAGVSHAF